MHRVLLDLLTLLIRHPDAQNWTTRYLYQIRAMFVFTRMMYAMQKCQCRAVPQYSCFATEIAINMQIVSASLNATMIVRKNNILG